MGHFVENKVGAQKQILCVFANISKEELHEKIKQRMADAGYKALSESIGNTVYEKGNRTMRLLFGIFVDYFKCSIHISENENNQIEVFVKKETTGFSGGIIGMTQVDDKLKLVYKLLETL